MILYSFIDYYMFYIIDNVINWIYVFQYIIKGLIIYIDYKRVFQFKINIKFMNYIVIEWIYDIVIDWLYMNLYIIIEFCN